MAGALRYLWVAFLWSGCWFLPLLDLCSWFLACLDYRSYQLTNLLEGLFRRRWHDAKNKNEIHAPILGYRRGKLSQISPSFMFRPSPRCLSKPSCSALFNLALYFPLSLRATLLFSRSFLYCIYIHLKQSHAFGLIYN